MSDILTRLTPDLTPADQLSLLSAAGREADADDVRAVLQYARERFKQSDGHAWACLALIAARTLSLQQGGRFGLKEVFDSLDMRADALDATAEQQIADGLQRLRRTLRK